ncbi:sodium-dependent transporter, partial [Halorubrum sp. Atlit-28R]
QLPAGTLIATTFFAVVTLAALSSSISMLEIPVAFLVDEYGVSRKHAVISMTAIVAVTGTVCAFNPAIFGFVAGTLVNILMTAGLAAFLLFVGWVMGRDAIEEFASGAGEFGRTLGTPWLFAVGVILPLFLVFTLLTHFGVDTNIGFWPTVALA